MSVASVEISAEQADDLENIAEVIQVRVCMRSAFGMGQAIAG